MCLFRMPSVLYCRMLMLRRLFLGVFLCAFGEGILLGEVRFCVGDTGFEGGSGIVALRLWGGVLRGVGGGGVCGVGWLVWRLGGV